MATTPHSSYAMAIEFSVLAIENAVQQSQNNDHTYLDFIQKTSLAGCVGYFVQITDGCVIYFGRKGESQIECFSPGLRWHF